MGGVTEEHYGACSDSTVTTAKTSGAEPDEAGREKRNCEKENGEEKTNSSVLLPASVVMCVSVP